MATVNFKHIMNRINSNEIDSTYSLFGNEAFLQKFFIDSVSLKFLNKEESVTYINLDDDKESLLLSELSSYSLFNQKKLIIVRRIKKISNNGRKELADYIKSPNTDYCLILISENHDFRNSLQKELEKISTSIDVRVPFDNKIREWVTYYIKNKKYDINSEIISDLVDKYGDSISHVINEIENLHLFGLNDSEYYKKLEKTYSLWQLQDAVGKKDISNSLTIGNSLLINGISLVQIVTNLSNVFFQLLYADNSNKFRYTGLNKIIMNNLKLYNKKYTLQETENAIIVLRNYDIIFKSSSIKDSTILNIVVTKICSGIN